MQCSEFNNQRTDELWMRARLEKRGSEKFIIVGGFNKLHIVVQNQVSKYELVLDSRLCLLYTSDAADE